MKHLHRKDLFTWSEFNAERNIDFNSILWVRENGNVIFDPLPLTEHDKNHLQELGGADWIIITNSDHIRVAQEIKDLTGAKIVGPIAEKETFPIQCDHYLTDQEELVPGLKTMELNGSKTAGELCFLLEETTLITGDLIRAHSPNNLMILPQKKLKDLELAIKSISGLLEYNAIDTVLVGDGWHIFKDGYQHLKSLCEELNNK